MSTSTTATRGGAGGTHPKQSAADHAAEAPASLRPRAVTAEAWQMLSGLLEATRLMPPRLRAPDASLPLTLLSGFLGAGKTTLLNRLLTHPEGRRIVVLVNDFGRINIDASLVRSRTEDMISLTNGCACCTVSTDLTRTLIDLAQRPDPPDAIVLEASGLADPRGIAQVALSNPSLRLDGVLTLVDAVQHAQAACALELRPTIDQQVDAADLIVLTKTDEASPEQTQAARRLLAERHPGKALITAVHGDLPANLVLGLGSSRDFKAEPPVPWNHAQAFEACALQSPAALDQERLLGFFEQLPPTLLRAKGVLWVAQDPARRMVFQRVGRRWSLQPEEGWGSQAPSSSLVLIGPKGSLNHEPLKRSFQGLAAGASERPA